MVEFVLLLLAAYLLVQLAPFLIIALIATVCILAAMVGACVYWLKKLVTK